MMTDADLRALVTRLDRIDANCITSDADTGIIDVLRSLLAALRDSDFVRLMQEHPSATSELMAMSDMSGQIAKDFNAALLDSGREAETAPLDLEPYKRQVAELCKQAQEAEWRPIETAPKDGSWFFVKREADPARPKRILESVFRWDESYGMWFAGTGWWQNWPMGWTLWKPLAGTPGGKP